MFIYFFSSIEFLIEFLGVLSTCTRTGKQREREKVADLYETLKGENEENQIHKHVSMH